MTYRYNRRDTRNESLFGERHLVEKILDGGECYLVASYQDEGAAKAALSLLALSEEARDGQVEFGSWSQGG